MIRIRNFEFRDVEAVGRLIAYMYGTYNLDFVPVEERGPYLGPFQYVDSPDEEHRRAIAEAIQAPLVIVAENEVSEVVGVLRGSPGRLHSWFVSDHYHQNGIGRSLVLAFEAWCRQQDVDRITLASTLYAVAFYQSVGYKKSTGVRRGWSFDGRDLFWQPMKKLLS